MSGPVLLLVVMVLVPFFVIVWNKMRVKGKILCFFLRKDKSLLPKLCKLESDFVVFVDRAYDIYPDFVRVTRFPAGWPTPLQEVVPTMLYDEEDAIPLDWINLDNRLERAMELKAALDENFFKRLVTETTKELSGGALGSWKKYLPFILVGVGVVGLVVLLVLR